MKFIMPIIIIPIVFFFVLFTTEEIVKSFPGSRFFKWWRKNVIADWSDRNDV